MTIPRNNNREQPSNSIGISMVATMSTEPILLSSSIIAIQSMTVALSTLPEGTFLSPIAHSHPVTPRPIMATEVRPFATSFKMPMLGHEQPYGMPRSMMANLQTNPVTFADSIANTYSS